MTVSRETPETVAGRLDPASKTAITACSVRLCVPVALVLWPFLTGFWPFDKTMQVLALWLSASSGVSVVAALWRKEPFDAGSLNRWDESLVLLALARLAHLAQLHHG